MLLLASTAGLMGESDGNASKEAEKAGTKAAGAGCPLWAARRRAATELLSRGASAAPPALRPGPAAAAAAALCLLAAAAFFSALRCSASALSWRRSRTSGEGSKAGSELPEATAWRQAKSSAAEGRPSGSNWGRRRGEEGGGG